MLQGSISFVETREKTLESYYSNPREHAFINQLSFTTQFVEQAVSIFYCNGIVIQDKSIYDTHGVFTKYVRDENLINEFQYGLLNRLAMSAYRLVKPDIVIMLDASVSVCYGRVIDRAIKDEMQLSIEYLNMIRVIYYKWFTEFDIEDKILISTTDLTIDEVSNRVNEEIVTRIKQKIV
jgi:deoxyadenosine/deoxycytidine kinase